MLIEKIKNLFFYKKMERFYKKYERVFLPAVLVFGFVFDVFTFRSIEIFTSFILLGVYMFLTGASIVFINTVPFSFNKFVGFLRLFAPIAMQFGFGALLSMSFVFYYFGGAFSISWPLVLTILFLMSANEIFKEYYKKPIIQLGIFFWCLLTLFFLMFPYIFNSLSSYIFILGGVAAVLVMMLFVRVLAKFSQDIKQIQKSFTLYIVAIFGFMNILYFANIVPPIPLSLRDGGVYHSVKRIGAGYEVMAERESFWQKIIPGKIIHTVAGKPVYVYTAIFSPADLNTEIVHHWQKYIEESGEWATTNKASFKVIGGRTAGYRGYSLSSNITPGRWRVFIETKRGQVLGKISFEVERVVSQPQIKVLSK